jgi:putative membrane protein
VSGRLPVVLLCLFLAAAVALGIAPYDRSDWLLENALVVAVLAAALAGHRRRPLSDTAYVALFVFLLLHEVGAHYTYSQVPWAHWWQALTGMAPPAGRNQFDRVVHFSYGLLLAPAVADWTAARTPLRGLALRVVVVATLTAGSALYEMIEWAAAEAFGGDLGVAYLGTQGDVWDAQKDMAVALLGSLLWAVVPGAPTDRRSREAIRPSP